MPSPALPSSPCRSCARLVACAAALLALAAGRRAPAHTLTVGGRDSAAIAAAVARSRSGDTVVLPAGVYSVTEPIRPRSGTRLAGEGQARTTLRFAGRQHAAIVDLSDRQDVRVSRLTLDAAMSALADQGIFAHHAARLRIDHVTVRNLAGRPGFPIGIHFTGDNPTRANGVTDSAIEDCLLENLGVGSDWGGGVRFSWGSAHNRVERCVIRQTGRGGIFANDGSGDLVLRGNTVTGSHGEGLALEVWGGCDRCVVEDNRLDHWLSIGDCDRCAVRRNTVSSASGEVKFIGIEVIGSEEVVTDNVVDGGQQIGISVSNNGRKEHVFYGYNRVERCVQWGAQLQGDASGLTGHYFYRCRFADNGADTGKPIYPNDAGHGFRINQNARGVVLDTCDIVGNRGIGIQVHGSPAAPSDRLVFARCRVAGNRREAAAVWPGYTQLAWQGCTVSGNGVDVLPPARGTLRPADAIAIDAPRQARVGQAVRFALRGMAPGSFVVWDLGDGVPATTAAAAHAYPRAGRYRVSVVAWDANGDGSHAETTVAVR